MTKKREIVDKWLAVTHMAEKFVEQGKTSSRHVVPSADEMKLYDGDSKRKCKEILGDDCYKDFKDAFRDVDRYGDDEIDTEGLLDAIKLIGGVASQTELREYFKRTEEYGNPLI